MNPDENMNWASFERKFRQISDDLRRENRDARTDDTNHRNSTEAPLQPSNSPSPSSPFTRSHQPVTVNRPQSSPRPGIFQTGRFSLGKGSYNRAAGHQSPHVSRSPSIPVTPNRVNNNASNFNNSNTSSTTSSPSNSGQQRTAPNAPPIAPIITTATNSPPRNLFHDHPTVNAQCLSPRPRPKALPIGGFELDRSPVRKPQLNLPNFNTAGLGLNLVKARNSDYLNPPGIAGSQSRSRDELKSFPNNNSVTFNNKLYPCSESDLKFLTELGAGSCGQVSKQLHIPSGNIFAVKQMRRSGDDEETKRIVMDLGVLLKCHSEHIVQCYGYLIRDAEVLICMELMGTCFEKLLKKMIIPAVPEPIPEPIPEHIVGKIAVATVKALHYVKENHGIIHRDVKPSNILINGRGEIKLCDFGIAGHLVDSKAKTRQAGCAAYMAPERIDPPDPQNPRYDIRADVWSLGITLVEMAIGRFPYLNCKTDFEVLSRIVQDPAPILPENGQFSPEFCEFIRDW